MTNLPALAEALRTIAGPDVGVGVADPAAPAPALMPEEIPATTRMIPKRLREFAAGRSAARNAMSDLGVTPQAIPMGPNRAPIWPEALNGSIAHCDLVAAAIVTLAATPLGLDIEEDSALPYDLWHVVLTEEEQKYLSRQPVADQGKQAKSLFCAKEAVHKLHSPLSNQLLPFNAVTITLEGEKFLTSLPTSVPSIPKLLCGQILRCSGVVAAVLTGH